jgi:hypothetical protein
MEVRSSGSSKGNPGRSPVVFPLKIYHNSGIEGVKKTAGVFQQKNPFIAILKIFLHQALKGE